jgi:hypothetical protein
LVGFADEGRVPAIVPGRGKERLVRFLEARRCGGTIEMGAKPP